MLLDGVARVGRGAKNLSDSQWESRCCGDWTAADTARHLLALARAHHRWLDAAISGDNSLPDPAPVLDPDNEAAIRFLSEMSGPDAVAEFVRTAGRYANRVADYWDTPIGVPGGVVTVGQHCALIALEYHLHAWDLAQMNGDTRYEPPRVKQLLSAVGEAKAVQASSVDALKILTVTWVRHRYQAWRYLLSASGRKPSRHSKLSATIASVKQKVPTFGAQSRIPQTEPTQNEPHQAQDDSDPTPEQVIDLRGDGELPLPVTDRTGVTAD